MCDELEHDVFGYRLDRCGDVHFTPRDARFRVPRRSAKDRLESRIRHLWRSEKAERAGVELNRSVVADIDQLLANQIRVARFAVGRETHQLVLPRVGRNRRAGARKATAPARVAATAISAAHLIDPASGKRIDRVVAIVRGDTVIAVETSGQVPAGMSAIELGISTALPD